MISKVNQKQSQFPILKDQETLQELRMLASVTLNCQVTKIVRIQVPICQNCNQCLKCSKSRLSLQLLKWQKKLLSKL